MEEKVLFKDDIKDEKEILKYMKKIRISILTFMIFFIVLSIFLLVVCLIKEKYIGLVAVGVSLVISLLLLVMVLSYRKKNYSYLYIYDNKIIVKCYGKNEMIIDITPCEYFIRILKPSFFNLKYGLTLEFQDKKYNVLLKYKSLTLYPSEKNKESKKWEEDIFRIGCKVVDRDNLIINK